MVKRQGGYSWHRQRKEKVQIVKKVQRIQKIINRILCVMKSQY